LAVRKQLVLEVQTAEYPLTVDADPLRLEQVLWNLLANAIKFTPEGGTVKVYTRRENGWAHTIVEDTGLGIDPNFLPYVFDRFRQQDSSFTRRHGGLGIGMSIAKSIAELHGGDLLVESGGKWKGSRFTLRLPISLRRATGHLTGDLLTEKGRELLAAFESQVSEPAGVQNGVRTVIVVDATGQCAILVSQILGRYGYRVHSTASPSRAVELAVDEGAMAVLVDAEVDDSSATCVAESMRNAGVTTPALIIVDGRDRGKLERARRDGYAGYLDKPIRRTELLETLEQIVSRQG
jgi:CheY-like chemotaxis protein